MKRRITQADADRIRDEYLKWDKFGAGSETVNEFAKRIGVSRSTLYVLRNKGWRVDGAAAAQRDERDNPLAPIVRELFDELVAARLRIAELERRVDEDG